LLNAQRTCTSPSRSGGPDESRASASEPSPAGVMPALATAFTACEGTIAGTMSNPSPFGNAVGAVAGGSVGRGRLVGYRFLVLDRGGPSGRPRRQSVPRRDW